MKKMDWSRPLRIPPPSAPQTPPFHKQGACVCWLGATFPMFCHGNPPTSSPQLHWLQGTSFPGDFTSSWAWLIFFWETLVMGIGWAVSVFKWLCITVDFLTMGRLQKTWMCVWFAGCAISEEGVFDRGSEGVCVGCWKQGEVSDPWQTQFLLSSFF